MNVIKTTLLLILCLSINISANTDISAQIKQLKHAKKSEKYVIMNKIKIQIAKLNSAQRAKAIAQLRGAMPGSGTNIQVPQISVPSISIPIQSIPVVPLIDIPIITPPITLPLTNVPVIQGGQ